jgi:transcriptional regulator with XRE-family HTH domain
LNKTWLADTIGYDVATVSRWCSNVTQPPLKVLYKIAELLDVDIKDLLVSKYFCPLKHDIANTAFDLIHAVIQNAELEVFLHLRDIDYPSLG